MKTKEVGLIYSQYPIAIFEDNDNRYYLGEWDYYNGRSCPRLILNDKTKSYSLEQIRTKTKLDIRRRNDGRHIIMQKRGE